MLLFPRVRFWRETPCQPASNCSRSVKHGPLLCGDPRAEPQEAAGGLCHFTRALEPHLSDVFTFVCG